MEYKNKIAWQCRRGMLELDVILQGFFTRQWDHLSAQEQTEFAALLESTDPELLHWLVTKEPSENKSLHHIIDKILHENRP